MAETAYVPPTIARSGAAEVNSTTCVLELVQVRTGRSAARRESARKGQERSTAALPAESTASGSNELTTGAEASVRVSGGDDGSSSPATSSSREITGRPVGAARSRRGAEAEGGRREQALGVGETEHGRGIPGALLRGPVAAVVDPEHRALE